MIDFKRTQRDYSLIISLFEVTRRVTSKKIVA